MAHCPDRAKALTGAQPACAAHVHLWQKEPRRRTATASVPSRAPAKHHASHSLGRRSG